MLNAVSSIIIYLNIYFRLNRNIPYSSVSRNIQLV